MVKSLTQVLGWVFVVVGILGFVPGVTNDGMLLGLFKVDTVHNIVHLLTGAIAIWAASAGYKASKTYLQVFGIVYLLVAILGFLAGDGMVLGFLSNNMADTWLHLVLALVILYGGFMAPADEK